MPVSGQELHIVNVTMRGWRGAYSWEAEALFSALRFCHYHCLGFLSLAFERKLTGIRIDLFIIIISHRLEKLKRYR